jgi:NADPH:quinone reductase-like Zn-dependent oxidoreductase
MQAIVQDSYGSADVLELRNIDKPVPGDDEVLVRVRAAGVDRGVWHLMTGLPYLLRVAGYGLRAPRTRVRGREVAGVVEAVGGAVARFRPGDEVMGLSEGSFAEYACAREGKLARKPANLSFQQAAAVPVSGSTALQGLRDQGRLQPDQKVLVIGAAGGVGSFAVQLAKAFGAEVTGVCSTGQVDLVRSLGADHVVDYTREDVTDGSRRYDLVLDTAGRRPLSRLRRALARRGTLVLVGGEGGDHWTGGMGRQLRALAIAPFVGQRMRVFINKERRQELEQLTELIEAGNVTPVVGRTYPLDEAPEAVRDLVAGHRGGKLVITI